MQAHGEIMQGVNGRTEPRGNVEGTSDPSSQGCRGQWYQFFISPLPSLVLDKADSQALSLGFSAVTRIMFWFLDRMKDEKEGGSPENSRIRAEKEGKREKEVGRREQGKKRGNIERREV